MAIALQRLKGQGVKVSQCGRGCAIVPCMDEKREMLRHTLATVAYRAARALEGAPDHFAGFAGAGRMPVEILAHMGNLFDWALSAAVGQEHWHSFQPLGWAKEQERFFGSLKTFDAF